MSGPFVNNSNLDLEGAESILYQQRGKKSFVAGVCLKKCANRSVKGKCNTCCHFSNFRKGEKK